MERIHWIDYCKVLGIYLVILGHFTPNYMESFSSQYIYSFHIPLFFIISGYLIKPYNSTQIRGYIFKLCRSLYIPFLLLSVIGLAVQLFYDSLTGSNTLSTMGIYDVGGAIKSIAFGSPFGWVNSMWFVFTLLIVKFIDLMIYTLGLKSKLYKYLIYVVVLSIIFLSSLGIISFIPDKILRVFYAYPFFVIGRIIHNNNCIMKIKDRRITLSIMVLTLFMPVISIYSNGFVDLFLGIFGNNIFMYYLWSIVISLLVLLVIRQIFNKHIDYVQTLSNGTLLILAYHKIVLYVFEQYNENFLLRLFISFFTLIIFYYPIKYIEKFCPILIGKTKK